MKTVYKFLLCNVLIVCVLFLCSWGYLVHKTVHQLAVYQLPTPLQNFFYANMDYLVNQSARPDKRKRFDSTEGAKHFIDFEYYGENAQNKMPTTWQKAVKKYTADTLYKYGYVPFVVVEMQNKLTEAFRQCKKDSILFYANDLGHYIGDAHVPLHTTENYDGQLTNQKGLHALWETTIPEIEINQFNLSTTHKATYISNVEATIWKTVRTSYAMVNNVLEQEKKVSATMNDATKFRTQIRNGKETKQYSTAFAKAYNVVLKNTINERLITTSQTIADFFYFSWVNAGKPNLENCFATPSELQLKNLQAELLMFKNNQLIQNNMLKAKAK